MTVNQIINITNGCTKIALYGGTNKFRLLWSGTADDAQNAEIPYMNTEIDYITVPSGTDTLIISITTEDLI